MIEIIIIGLFYLIVSAGIGCFFGYLGVILYKKLSEKTLQKKLKDIIDGKKENSYNFEGKNMIANNFRIPSDNVHKIIKIDEIKNE